jgi:hypothetical protein
LLSLSVGITLGLAACGGSSDVAGKTAYDAEADTTMTTSSPPLTKARFTQQINKRCRRVWIAILNNWAIYTRTQDAKLGEKARFAQAVQYSLLAGIDFHIFDGIYRLGAPPGDERTIERIIGPMQEAVELGWKGKWVASSAAQVAEHFRLFNERARQYGLDDCVATDSRLRPIEP